MLSLSPIAPFVILAVFWPYLHLADIVALFTR